MSNFEIIKDCISKSSVPFGDQIDLLDLFSKAEDAELSPVAELFTQDGMWVARIHKNYKDKKVAIETKDMELWRRIIEDEKKELAEIEKYNSQHGI